MLKLYEVAWPLYDFVGTKIKTMHQLLIALYLESLIFV